jgi:hypothetical protein
VYRPFGMPWLLLPGLATVLAVLAGTVTLALRRRRRAGAPPGGEVQPRPA